jgi:hypothetical protein
MRNGSDGWVERLKKSGRLGGGGEFAQQDEGKKISVDSLLSLIRF